MYSKDNDDDHGDDDDDDTAVTDDDDVDDDDPGGTIDVVAHKIRKDGRVRELFRATGGAWGGTIIDRQFKTLMENVFGKDFIDAFCQEYAKDFVELLQVKYTTRIQTVFGKDMAAFCQK